MSYVSRVRSSAVIFFSFPQSKKFIFVFKNCLTMQGLSFSSLRKHTALIPLFVCVGAGCVGSIFYLARLGMRNPEVSWNKRGDQEPWNEYANKQYKFYSPNVDYKKLEAPPKY